MVLATGDPFMLFLVIVPKKVTWLRKMLIDFSPFADTIKTDLSAEAFQVSCIFIPSNLCLNCVGPLAIDFYLLVLVGKKG